MAIAHDLGIARPDYTGGSIVNLMSSIGAALGAPPSAYVPLAMLPQERLSDARRIVVVVIDGLGDELLAHLGEGSVLAGLRHDRMTSVYPPTTASAITTFMTGQAPQQHGITGWFMHFRELGTVTAVLPFVPRYTATPLSRHGIAMSTVVDCASFFDRIVTPSLCLMPGYIADSDFTRLLAGRARRLAYRGLGEFAAQLARVCSGGEGERYTYAYWSDLDRLAHEHGPSSAVVARHFAELDAALAPAVAACAVSGTLLVVTADHGFIDSGAAERIDLAAHARLADLLSLPLCGEPRAPYCYVRARAAGEFERQVRDEFAAEMDLVPSEDLLDAGWFGIGAPHPELRARIGDYTLHMRARYTLRDLVPGERNLVMNGMHGGVTAAEQYVPLLLAGP